MMIVVKRPFYFYTKTGPKARPDAERCEYNGNVLNLHFEEKFKSRLDIATVRRFIKQVIRLRKKEYKRSERYDELLLEVWHIDKDEIALSFCKRSASLNYRGNQIELVFTLEPLIKTLLYGPYNTTLPSGYSKKESARQIERLKAAGQWIEGGS